MNRGGQERRIAPGFFFPAARGAAASRCSLVALLLKLECPADQVRHDAGDLIRRQLDQATYVVVTVTDFLAQNSRHGKC